MDDYIKRGQWHECDKELPSEWKNVITFQPVSTGGGLVRIGVYIGNGKWREAEAHNMMELPVTHWMPLPNPPEVKE